MTLDEFEEWFGHWREYYDIAYQTQENKRQREHLSKLLVDVFQEVQPEEDRHMLMLKYSEYFK